MEKNFASNTNNEWLVDVYAKRRNRSWELGKAAIDALIAAGESVTMGTVHKKSKELDLTGKGVHPNTVRTNTDLYAYYQQHSRTYKQKQQRKAKPVFRADGTEDYLRLTPNRDWDKRLREVMKLSKEELALKLVQAEHYIAEQQSQWKKQLFEQFR